MFQNLISNNCFPNLDKFLALKFHTMKMVKPEDTDTCNMRKKSQQKNVYKISHL